MLTMLQHELIRRMVLIDGLSQREVARKLGHARKSVAKALILPAPEPYKLAASKPRPKLDESVDIVRQWLLVFFCKTGSPQQTKHDPAINSSHRNSPI